MCEDFSQRVGAKISVVWVSRCLPRRMKERSLLPMSLPTFDAAGKETGENQGVKKNGGHGIDCLTLLKLFTTFC